MSIDNLWDIDEPASNWIEVPEWIEQDITAADVEAINQGGCASGAYMPAVTYYKAAQTMAEHGDAVLDYIESNYGDLPQPPRGESWSGMACFFLSYAVELWAGPVADEIREAIEAGEED